MVPLIYMCMGALCWIHVSVSLLVVGGLEADVLDPSDGGFGRFNLAAR